MDNFVNSYPTNLKLADHVISFGYSQQYWRVWYLITLKPHIEKKKKKNNKSLNPVNNFENTKIHEKGHVLVWSSQLLQQLDGKLDRTFTTSKQKRIAYHMPL